MKLARDGTFDYKEHKETVPRPGQEEMGMNTLKNLQMH